MLLPVRGQYLLWGCLVAYFRVGAERQIRQRYSRLPFRLLRNRLALFCSGTRTDVRSIRDIQRYLHGSSDFRFVAHNKQVSSRLFHIPSLCILGQDQLRTLSLPLLLDAHFLNFARLERRHHPRQQCLPSFRNHVFFDGNYILVWIYFAVLRLKRFFPTEEPTKQ